MAEPAALPGPQIFRLEAAQRVYAIGDIHGRLDLLEPLVRRIEADMFFRPVEDAKVVCLGDYVDRGPQSRGVIENLAGGKLAGLPLVALKGNHEALMLDFLAGRDDGERWAGNGGQATMQSYGVKTRLPRQGGARRRARLRKRLIEAIPPAHLEFLSGLAPLHRDGDYLFVHAGLRPGVALGEQDESDLLWIRQEFYDAPRLDGPYVVHGHTPVKTPLILDRRADIDTGAWFSGHLTCLVIEGATRQALDH